MVVGAQYHIRGRQKTKPPSRHYQDAFGHHELQDYLSAYLITKSFADSLKSHRLPLKFLKLLS